MLNSESIFFGIKKKVYQQLNDYEHINSNGLI